LDHRTHQSVPRLAGDRRHQDSPGAARPAHQAEAAARDRRRGGAAHRRPDDRHHRRQPARRARPARRRGQTNVTRPLAGRRAVATFFQTRYRSSRTPAHQRGFPLRTTRRRFLLAASSLALAAALTGTGGLELFSHGALAQSVAEAELMQPGPLGDEVLGDEKASVTVIEYASMTCPHCAHFALTTFPQLKEKYIDTGKV